MPKHFPVPHAHEDKGSTALAQHVTRTATAGDVEDILKHFDYFSTKNKLGLHIGQEKGEYITAAVKRGLPATGPAVVLETGCHAGDGSIRAAKVLSEREGSTLISTEENLHWLKSAKAILKHANISGYTFRPMHVEDKIDFGEFLDILNKDHGFKTFDTVILDDQDQTVFGNHLKVMMEKGVLRKGSTLYVDNILTKEDDHKDLMALLQGPFAKSWLTE